MAYIDMSLFHYYYLPSGCYLTYEVTRIGLPRVCKRILKKKPKELKYLFLTVTMCIRRQSMIRCKNTYSFGIMLFLLSA